MVHATKGHRYQGDLRAGPIVPPRHLRPAAARHLQRPGDRARTTPATTRRAPSSTAGSTAGRRSSSGPRTPTEVAHVVSLARESGLELAVRSGGHSLAGHSVSDGGIVLDLSDMRALDIDAERPHRLGRDGADRGRVHDRGRRPRPGDRVRRHRLGRDRRDHAGRRRRVPRPQVRPHDRRPAGRRDRDRRRPAPAHVDAETHPDLFWAIRGGGGNFGVATRFQFRLHEVDTIVGGMLILPATPDVIASFVAEAEAAPEELSTIANVMVAPPMPFVPAEQHGQLVIMALLAYAGAVEAGERAVAPFRALATPIADMVRPMPYPEIYPLTEERPPTRSRGGAHDVRRRRRRPRGGDDRRPPPGLDRADGRGAAPGARRGDGPRARRRHRVRPPPERGSWWTSPRSTSTPDETAVHEAWVAGFAAALRQGDHGRRTSTSSATRARRASARPTRGRPGTGWRRSSAATTRPTSSGSTRTSRRRSNPLDHDDSRPARMEDRWSSTIQ